MKEQPWEPNDATQEIQKIANDPEFGIYWTSHARERLLQRDLIVGDILYLLKNGLVTKLPKPSTREGYFKYKIHSRTPNSDHREIGAICVPCDKRKEIKIISVMWMDEEQKYSGGTNKLMEPMKRKKVKL